MKELFITAFIITAPLQSNASNENAAYQSIAEASYKQSGLETMVNAYIQKKLKNVPEEVQRVASNSFLLGKMIYERKATYTWSF